MTQNSDEVEEVVRAAAADKQKPAATMRLFRSLLDVEVFFLFEDYEDGGRKQSYSFAPVTRRYKCHDVVHFQNSSRSVGYLRRWPPQRCASFTLKMPPLDWVILSNSASQWVAISKKQIPAILDDIHSNGNVAEGAVSPSVSGLGRPLCLSSSSRAQSTGSRAVIAADSVSAFRQGAILELVAGKTGEAGQPVMKTYKIQHFTNVVRVYLTRTRPHITYGGITWEALKDMMRTKTDIQGVQIINDADDWVVFDRESPVLR